jgi:hypothetical protein
MSWKSEESINELMAWAREHHPESLTIQEPFDPLDESHWRRLHQWVAEHRRRQTVEVTAFLENGELRLHEAEGVRVQGNEVIWPDGHRLIIQWASAPTP